MKNILLLSALCAVAVAFTGCAAMKTVNDNTPHTTIRGSVAGQPFSIENPKDTVLDGLTVSAGTNGVAMIRVDHLSTVMNTANITATGIAGEKLVEAGADAFERGMKATGSAAGVALGAAIK